jgi:hypothetical protein
MPHENSDVLNLPAPGTTAPYFTCEFDGCQKLTRKLHGLKLNERQGDQLFAQALQGPVFILFPGSAFIIRIHINSRLNFPPAAHLHSSHRRADFYTIQLILQPNSCINYPGAARAGFIQARNS